MHFLRCTSQSLQEKHGVTIENDKKEQKKPINQMNTFSDLPKNVCDGIKTKFDDLEEIVCKSLPTDTFDDIPQNTFDDIELAIDEN